MNVKYLPLIVFMALTGCGTTPQKPQQAPAETLAKSTTETTVQLPLDSWRYKIVEAAKEEWIYFGQQKVVVEQDDESIPHVGIWEDDDWAHSDRVKDYWRAVGVGNLSGMDCRQPWSAAFISWIMQAAGVPRTLFPPAIAHKEYLSHFLAQAQNPDAVFVPHTIKDYKPKPGDLICANRGRGALSQSEAVDEVPDRLNAKLHCDIVVETEGQTLHAIGGNVRNSVSKTILNLSPEGHLQLTSHRPWFLVIENRLD